MGFRKLLKSGGAALVIVLPASTYVAYKYRPRASTDLDFHEGLVRAVP